MNIDLQMSYASVTLRNLRDHGESVCEQIYVQSKLMIVDDRWVLAGSANINDRRLLGSGDSELAVTIADTAHSFNDLDGTGTPAPCRNFARELRQNAWRKWMGSAAAECEEALDKPALRASWEKIQVIAKTNADIYEEVFNFTPRNFQNQNMASGIGYSSEGNKTDKEIRIISSIWPTLSANKAINNSDAMGMPFSERFWLNYKHQPFKNKTLLGNIKGYFITLATQWTSGEDNLIPYNMKLISQLEKQEDSNQATAINSKDRDKKDV